MDLLTTDISRNQRLKLRDGKARSFAPNTILSQKNQYSNKKSDFIHEQDPDFEGVVIISKQQCLNQKRRRRLRDRKLGMLRKETGPDWTM